MSTTPREGDHTALTAYALTRGSYSDYRVIAVFADEADAKAAQAAYNGESDEERGYHTEASVESMLFFPAGTTPRKSPTYHRSVVIHDDGTLSDAIERAENEWEFDRLYWVPPNGRPTVRYVRAPIYQNRAGRLEVRGLDKQGVDQAYNDNLAQLKVDSQFRRLMDAKARRG